jgi:glycosyltransferase involved in cell wall biosynthesis
MSTLQQRNTLAEPVTRSVVRILALLESDTVTGPAKNLLEFCRISRSLEWAPQVQIHVAVFVRTNRRADTDTESNELIFAVKSHGLELHCIRERFPFDPRVVRSLRRLARHLQPDIIQTHFVKSHFLVRLSRVWRGRRWIAFHHGYTTDATRTRFYNQLDRWSLRVPDQVVTVCAPFKQQLCSLGVPASRIRILHNGISPDWLERGSRAEISTADKPNSTAVDRVRTVLAVGRLSQEKAFADLIVAVSKLRQLRPDLFIQLFIVGDGSERMSLEQLIRTEGLNERARLLGHVGDVRPYYAQADVLAITSLSEGSPNVLLEGMAAGVPVVATCVGGIPEIVTDRESGLLVKPREPEAIAAAINLLLSDAELSKMLAANAHERIRTRHSPQARAACLLQLYGEVLGCAAEVPRNRIPIYAETKVKFSVVVPVLNSKRHLRGCLDSILTAIERYGNAELIVLDNGSVDGSYEILLNAYGDKARIQQICGVPVGALRNRGAALATGEFVTFIDSDCTIIPDYFEKAVQVLQFTGADATGSEYGLDDSCHWIEKTWYLIHTPKSDGPVKFITSGNLVVRRAAFLSINGFDENMISCEDMDLGTRLNQAGFKVYQAHSVRALHVGGDKSLRVFFLKNVWRSMGMLGMLRHSWLFKPVLTLCAYLLLCAAGVAFLVASHSPLVIRIAIFILLVNVAPGFAVLYRGLQIKRFYAPLRSILLYHLYFAAQIFAIWKALTSARLSPELRHALSVRLHDRPNQQ